MKTVLKLAALAVTLAFTLLVGMRLGGDPSLLPPGIRELSGAPSSASFDEAIGLIERDYYRKVNGDALQNAGISAAVGKLRDRFSAYLDPREYRTFRNNQNPHFSGVGLDVRFSAEGLFVVRTFPGTPAEKAGIRQGETVIAVNGRSLRGRGIDASTALVQGRPGSTVRLTVKASDGKRRTIEVKRARILVPSVESRTVVGPGGRKVGVVALSGFVEGAGAQVAKAVRGQLDSGAKAIVLDLRGNGGGLLDEAVSVASVFIAKGTIVVTKGRNRPRQVYRASGDAIARGVSVVVLVDGETASASEIVAGAVQDSRRGIVVGSRTFGKGVFQEITELSNGGALDITVGEYFTPAGRNLGGGGVRKGAGVDPDIRVAPTAGTRAALDAAVAAAAKRAQ